MERLDVAKKRKHACACCAEAPSLSELMGMPDYRDQMPQAGPCMLFPFSTGITGENLSWREQVYLHDYFLTRSRACGTVCVCLTANRLAN